VFESKTENALQWEKRNLNMAATEKLMMLFDDAEAWVNYSISKLTRRVCVGPHGEPEHSERPHAGRCGTKRAPMPRTGGGEQAALATAGTAHTPGEAYVGLLGRSMWRFVPLEAKAPLGLRSVGWAALKVSTRPRTPRGIHSISEIVVHSIGWSGGLTREKDEKMT